MSKLLIHTGLKYTATHSCDKPLNVRVDVYSSEMQNVNVQEMTVFFQSGTNSSIIIIIISSSDAARLYVAAKICSTVSNGQCIKDPTNLDSGLYTAVVSAMDAAGNSNAAECQVKSTIQRPVDAAFLSDLVQLRVPFACSRGAPLTQSITSLHHPFGAL